MSTAAKLWRSAECDHRHILLWDGWGRQVSPSGRCWTSAWQTFTGMWSAVACRTGNQWSWRSRGVELDPLDAWEQSWRQCSENVPTYIVWKIRDTILYRSLLSTQSVVLISLCKSTSNFMKLHSHCIHKDLSYHMKVAGRSSMLRGCISMDICCQPVQPVALSMLMLWKNNSFMLLF